MKFVKAQDISNSSSASIIWNPEKNGYTYGDGQTIGKLCFNNYDEVNDAYEFGIPQDVLDSAELKNFDKNKLRLRKHQVERNVYAPTNTYDCDVVFEESKNELPYGVFEMKVISHEVCFKPYKKNDENVTLIKNKSLKTDVVDFFTKKVETGRKNKMGMLLYGPPGNGKTTEIMSLFDVCEELKLRVFILSSSFHLEDMTQARSVLNGENCVFVLEEITERLGRGLEELLTFLDGENSWANSITIATTNYPEDMPANLVDRPGRFEKFIEYNNPTAKEIVDLCHAFNIHMDQAVVLTGQGLSFDYVSFILSQSVKLGLSVKETRDAEESKRKRLSSTFKGKIGF